MATSDPVIKLEGEIADLTTQLDAQYVQIKTNQELLERKKKLREALAVAMTDLQTWDDLKTTVAMYDNQVQAALAPTPPPQPSV
jgi:hypothetical protein